MITQTLVPVLTVREHETDASFTSGKKKKKKKKRHSAEKNTHAFTILDSHWSRNMESDDVVPTAKSRKVTIGHSSVETRLTGFAILKVRMSPGCQQSRVSFSILISLLPLSLYRFTFGLICLANVD